MKKILFRCRLSGVSILLLAMFQTKAQVPTVSHPPVAADAVISMHQVIIHGQPISYKATAGTLPVYAENGRIKARLFYTFYERKGVKKSALRPLVFCFNGGPGASSMLLHLGYAGPRIVNLDEEGYPVFPYGVKNNDYSVLDIADMVYVDPVGTGFSRFEPADSVDKGFLSPGGDVAYLADWIKTFLSQHKRWLSPKYLLGESYASVRVAGLAGALLSDNIDVNGVVIVSGSNLGWSTGSSLSNALSAVVRLPYYTKLAWSAGKLEAGLLQKDSASLLKEVKNFTCDQLIPAVTRGGFIDPKEKAMIAAAVARYTGLSAHEIIQNNLLVDTAKFFGELSKSPPGELANKEHPDNGKIVSIKSAVDDLLRLMPMCLAAHYHKLLSLELEALSVEKLEEQTEGFIVNELFPAFFREEVFLLEDQEKKKEIVSRIAAYTGLPNADLEGHELTYFRNYFWEYANGKPERSIARGYDMRFAEGEDTYKQPFGPLINSYLCDSLHYQTTLPYRIQARIFGQWSMRDMNAEEELRNAMMRNHHMQVMFQMGYYDYSCTYLAQKIGNMWQLDPSGQMRERIQFKSYGAGHVMYIRKSEQQKATTDLRNFVLQALPTSEKASAQNIL